MRRIALLLLLLIPVITFAQNLVPNWSFEDTVSCPDNLTQIERASGWATFGLTPDYFNAYAPNNVTVPLSVPHNLWGDQIAHTGSAYAAFIAFASAGSLTREFIATQLTQSLTVGQKYFLSFWVSTCFGYLQNGYPGLACNNIGAKFTTIPFSQISPQDVNNTAHIVDTTIINDTINWIKISGSFIADSSYQYISIGNFYDNQHTSFSFNGSAFNQAIYYLDDVKLSPDSIFVNEVIELKSNLIQLFPVPALGFVTVSGEIINEIEIYDMLGNVCMHIADLSISTYKIKTSNLKHGIYLVRIKTKKEYVSKKIIIDND